MAAPATTARTTPLGIPLENGFPVKIAFSLDPDISFWEKGGGLPGWDGGDMIDITTHFNTAVRTGAPRALATLTSFTKTVAYDPDAYDEVLAILNKKGSVTIHFPDLSTLDFYGYLQKFEPQDMDEGGQPEAQITIQPTNWDPVSNIEVSPVMTEVAGT